MFTSHEMAQEIMQLSSGTIANLFRVREYDKVDREQAAFAKAIRESRRLWNSWQEAFKWYDEECFPTIFVVWKQKNMWGEHMRTLAAAYGDCRYCTTEQALSHCLHDMKLRDGEFLVFTAKDRHRVHLWRLRVAFDKKWRKP